MKGKLMLVATVVAEVDFKGKSFFPFFLYFYWISGKPGLVTGFLFFSRYSLQVLMIWRMA